LTGVSEETTEVQRFLGTQEVNVKLENDESWNLLLTFADKTGAFEWV
jgi:hypothetical protein